MRTLVVVPARGDSKGIPRKNLRPLGGKPLIAHVLETARRAHRVDAVWVTTDSAEIATTAERFGARVVLRDPALALDHVTLDPVIADAVERIEGLEGVYDLVLTVQPTSPLVLVATIDRIVERMATEPEIDSILTARDDTHLAWRERDGRIEPDYAARVNRQALPKRFAETGGVMATRRRHVTPQGRFGACVSLEVVSALEGLDIDTTEDWLFAEAALARRRLAFVVIGNRQQGLGHVTRVLTLMQLITGHPVRAFCTPDQDLAIDRFRGAFFPIEVVPRAGLIDAIERFGAEVVVHDELDTREEDLGEERRRGLRVVCFEDVGAGLTHADLLFNELYPEEETDPDRHHFYGPDVYVLRDEFLTVQRRAPREVVETVLVTFGGTDPSRLTLAVLDAIAPVRPPRLIVVAGRGVEWTDELARACDAVQSAGAEVTLLRDVSLMSEVMAQADLAFSSAGRTVYELAHMCVPTIVLAQNEKELKHRFAGPRSGCLNLGLGTRASPEAIRGAYIALARSAPLRESLRERMLALNLTRGRDFVVRQLLELV
ncbi:MAG: NTP transferase domain-containing protein [Polyangiaceae bacterium]|nr:NTP transferase domain-containing protein [Polyangiaceae bacterium]